MESKSKWKWAGIIAGIAVIMAVVLVVVFANIKNERKISSDFCLTDMKVVDKISEDYEFYVTIQDTMGYTGWEEYFTEPQTVKLKSEDYYKLISPDSVYMSVRIWIEMSYAQAKENQVLTDKNELDIAKILEDKTLMKKYCTIIDMTYSDEKSNIMASDESQVETSEILTLQQSEIDTAIAFYKKKDYSDDDARTEAINYLLKREALYQEAIKAGYAATDEEVWAYLDELKEILKNADNKEAAEEAMSVFDSEDDYWAFEFTVYQKNLPIQNYVKILETQYREKQNNSESAEQTWEDYFEQYKEKLIENRPYEIVEN